MNLEFDIPKNYRYILDKSSKKHCCPNCEKKQFVRYVDTEYNKYLPAKYGRCDREINCAYDLNPYKDGYSKGTKENKQPKQINPITKQRKPIKKPKHKTVFIPVEILNGTCTNYEKNIFIQNLFNQVAFPFKVKDVEKVIAQYHLGTMQKSYLAGAITFPYIDEHKNIRTIQVIKYNEFNRKMGLDFLHSILEKHYKQKSQPLKVSCLFGEHLLHQYPHNPVALVEAPKTAIYGTLYFGFPKQPNNLLWLAVYNLSSLNFNKCKVLKGREVFLFPDLSKDGRTFDVWSKKANEIQNKLEGTYFKVSDLLEQLASKKDKKNGYDIADYLIKLDWRNFR